MSEPVTQAQFYERMEQSDVTRLAQHQRMRDALEAMRTEVLNKLDDHAKDDLAVARDVTILMNERDLASKQAISRSTVITLFIAAPASLAALWSLLHALK